MKRFLQVIFLTSLCALPLARGQAQTSAKPAETADEAPSHYAPLDENKALESAGKQLYRSMPKDGDLEFPTQERSNAGEPNGFDEEHKAHTSSSTYLTMGILFMVSLLFLHKKSRI